MIDFNWLTYKFYGTCWLLVASRGPFFLKLRVRIKVNNTSLHGKFRRFLFPSSSKFPDQNFASYLLYIFPCDTRSEPGLLVVIRYGVVPFIAVCIFQIRRKRVNFV